MIQCKICGGTPEKTIQHPDGSGAGAFVSIKCACENRVTMRPQDAKLTGTVGESGWDYDKRCLNSVEKETERRWELLNS